MAIGNTATVDYETHRLKITLDTGIVGDSPIYARIYVPLETTVTTQQAYDMAYALAAFSEFDVYEVEILKTESLGPID